MESKASVNVKSSRNRQTDNIEQMRVPNRNYDVPSIPLIQRKSMCSCDGGCPVCKERESHGTDGRTIHSEIQPKLKVSQPNDPLEREADMIAEQIVDINHDYSIAKMTNWNTEEKNIDSQCSTCRHKDNDEEKQIQINRKGNSGNTVNSEFSDKAVCEINDVISNEGQPLDIQTKEYMETRFDYDFSNVRIHTDEIASKSAESINANAYTFGNHIVFRHAEYTPITYQGKRLLAHELAHIIQNNSSKMKNSRTQQKINENSINTGYSQIGYSLREYVFRQDSTARPHPRLDSTATNIIKFAKNSKNGSEKERVVETIHLIIRTYYPEHAANMPDVQFKQEVIGLETDVPVKPPGKDFKGRISVGVEFLHNITEDFFGHRVLTVGHELRHIEQYKLGMVGDKASGPALKHEREFLAFHWEATTPTITGTGRVSPATRRKIIDEALQHFYCLGEAKRQKYSRNISELRNLRVEMNRKAVTYRHPDIPEPTGCISN